MYSATETDLVVGIGAVRMRKPSERTVRAYGVTDSPPGFEPSRLLISGLLPEDVAVEVRWVRPAGEHVVFRAAATDRCRLSVTWVHDGLRR